ncbi:MAG: hypothetical protein EOO38_15920 [Cytophagaceae bacterium]|nr:MAG: hypothetical protein EOO38_15920 [Cytophagaceae bacterium]
MGKKKFFITIDTETTQTGKVADLGIVVSDKQGNIHFEGGYLLADFYSDREAHPLFHVFGDAKDIFSKASLPKRYSNYDAMLQSGKRMICSVAAINRLFAKIAARYPGIVATAYNKAFDWEKLEASGIPVADFFPKSFCLWHASVAKWGNTREYKAFVLQQHRFGARTKGGHMGIQTKADVMAKFLLGEALPDEPHTALEDARDYEVPILTRLVKLVSPAEYMYPPSYNWRDWALRDHYTVK